MLKFVYVQEIVKQSASLICFNLGYLPCAEDKLRTVTTKDTTVAAVAAALKVISSRGLISIMAYTQHPGKGSAASAKVFLLIAQCMVVMQSASMHRVRSPS